MSYKNQNFMINKKIKEEVDKNQKEYQKTEDLEPEIPHAPTEGEVDPVIIDSDDTEVNNNTSNPDVTDDPESTESDDNTPNPDTVDDPETEE